MHYAAPSFAPQRAPCGGATAHNFFREHAKCADMPTCGHPPLRRPRGGAHQTSQFWRLALSISVATCPPHRVLAPTFSGLVRTKPSLNSFLPRLPTGGGSPRDRARGPPPAAPLKRTSAGVHAVAVRPRGACMGPPSRSVTSISGHSQRLRSAQPLRRSSRLKRHRSDPNNYAASRCKKFRGENYVPP